jgi:hypothetical protein
MKHHAYFLEGPQSAFDAYKEELKPFWAKQFERFGVEEARALIQLTTLKNFGEATFFIAAASVTSEAQQALLKLFEEPGEGTTFVMLVPHGTLLPTLRSRMLPYSAGRRQRAGQNGLVEPTTTATRGPFGRHAAEAFLKSAPKARSGEVAKLLKDDEGARERVREFLGGLEAALHPHLAKKEVREGLEDIARVRSYLADRSPSLKMLLEHLAVSLPRLS